MNVVVIIILWLVCAPIAVVLMKWDHDRQRLPWKYIRTGYIVMCLLTGPIGFIVSVIVVGVRWLSGAYRRFDSIN